MFSHRIFIAVLLSALLGPGVGQIYNKKLRKGFILVALGLGLVSFVTFKMISVYFASRPDMVAIEKNPEVLNQFKSISAKELWILRPAGILLLLLWAYGIVDAYIDASRPIPQKSQNL